MKYGSKIDPPNRFEKVSFQSELDQVESDSDYLAALEKRAVEYIEDQSKTIVTKNDSPDLPFTYSLNPYRGCLHGCAYCYARPGHEFLGFNAGLDFETRIVIKRDAPELFREFLKKKSWKVEPISFSGVTDCYQPAEREFQLTRACLEVAAACNQPVSIVTKNALVIRDIDILQSMAEKNLVHVFVSVTTLNPQLGREMEPKTSIPAARLRAIRKLSENGVPVGVMVAPVIPGLNDAEIPSILRNSKEAGAIAAGTVLLRLPQTVRPVFEEWIRRVYPDKAEMVLGRIRQTRDGKFNDSRFGHRMKGTGMLAEQIQAVFRTFQKQLGLDGNMVRHNCELFIRPTNEESQQWLF